MKQLSAYRKPRDPGYVGGFYWTPTIVGFIGFLTNVFATQFVAWRFDYQPALGPAFVSIGSVSIYAPYKWFVWVWTQEEQVTFESNFRCLSARELLWAVRSPQARSFFS